MACFQIIWQTDTIIYLFLNLKVKKLAYINL